MNLTELMKQSTNIRFEGKNIDLRKKYNLDQYEKEDWE